LQGLIVWLSIGCLRAQPVNIVEIESAHFPIVEGQVELDHSDPHGSIDPSSILLYEDDLPCSVVSVDCSTAITRDPLGLVIACDVSESMGTWDPGLVLTRHGASRLVARRALGRDRAALLAFDDSPHRRIDWTVRGDELLAAIDTMRSGRGGTYYAAAMNDPPDGALRVAARCADRRHVVLFTDGGGTGDPDAIVRTVRTHDIRVHVIGIGRTAGECLRDVARASGGIILDNLTTIEEIDAAIDSLSNHLSPDSRCRVRWMGSPDCERDRKVHLWYNHRRGMGSYRTPTHAVRTVRVEPPMLELPAANETEANVVLHAQGGDVQVERIEADHPDVDVSPAGPFDMHDGDRRILRIRITRGSRAALVARITVASNACRPVVSGVRMAGETKFPIPTGLRLVHPNGGETFVAGQTQAFEWKGGDGRPVRCDISLDSGTTWRQLGTSTSSGRYVWRTTMTPATTCLARVAHDTAAIAGVLAPWNVGSLRFSDDGSLVVGERKAGSVIDIWDVDRRSHIMQIEGSTLIGTTRGGTEIIVGTHPSSVQTWSVASGEVVSRRSFAGLGHHGACSYSAEVDRCATIDWIGVDSSLLSIWSLNPINRLETYTFRGLLAADMSPGGDRVLVRPLFGGGVGYIVARGTVRSLDVVTGCAPLFDPDDEGRLWNVVRRSTSGERDSTIIVVSSTDDGRPLETIGPFDGTPVAYDVSDGGSLIGLVVDRGVQRHLIITQRGGSIVEERSLLPTARGIRLGQGGRRYAMVEGDSTVVVRYVPGHMSEDSSESCWSIVVPAVNVHIHDTTGWIGETASIRFEASTNVAGDPPMLDYRCELHIEPAQLLPLAFPSWIANNRRVVAIDGTLGSPAVAELPVIPLLGPADTLAITLGRFVWRDEEGNDIPATVGSSSGTFRIHGGCDDVGGRRVVDGDAPALRLLGADGSMEFHWSGFESGPGELSLYNVTGELLLRQAVEGPGGRATWMLDGVDRGIVVAVVRIGTVAITRGCIVPGK